MDELHQHTHTPQQQLPDNIDASLFQTPTGQQTFVRPAENITRETELATNNTRKRIMSTSTSHLVPTSNSTLSLNSNAAFYIPPSLNNDIDIHTTSNCDFVHPNKKRHIEDSVINASNLNTPTLVAMLPHNLLSNNSISNFSSSFIDDQNSLPLPSPSASPIHSSANDNIDDLNNKESDLNINTEIINEDTTTTTNTPITTTINSNDSNITDNKLTREQLIISKKNSEKFSLLSSLVANLRNASPEVNALIFQLLQKSDKKSLSNVYSTLNTFLKKDLILSLPAEIVYKIFQNFDHLTILKCCQVSKRWAHKVKNYPELWKNLIFKENLMNSNDEYENEFSLFKSNLPHLSNQQIPELIYKRRYLIQKRWMDVNYKPKKITLSGEALNVITCLQFDNDKIAAGSNANQIIIYNTESGKLMKTLYGHNGGVWAMKFYNNTLASGSTDRSVRIWNIEKGVCTHIFRGHTSTVRCLEIIEPQQIGTDEEGNPIIYPETPLLITGSRDATLYVWKLPVSNPDDEVPESPIDLDASDNPNFVTILKGHTASVRAVTGFANILISGSYDSTARVWDLRTGECKWILSGHTDRIYSCVYDIKRNRCFTGSVDNSVRIWDLNKGEAIAILEGHQILVGLITSSPNVLVSAAADSTVRIWDPDTGQARKVLRGHSAAITCVDNDDYKILSGSQGMLKLWDAKTGEFVRDMTSDVDGAVWQVSFDYRRCVSAVQRKDVTSIEVSDFCPPEDDPWLHPI